MFNEANEPSSACRLWRNFMVETSTPPSKAEPSDYPARSAAGQGKGMNGVRLEVAVTGGGLCRAAAKPARAERAEGKVRGERIPAVFPAGRSARPDFSQREKFHPPFGRCWFWLTATSNHTRTNGVGESAMRSAAFTPLNCSTPSTRACNLTAAESAAPSSSWARWRSKRTQC